MADEALPAPRLAGNGGAGNGARPPDVEAAKALAGVGGGSAGGGSFGGRAAPTAPALLPEDNDKYGPLVAPRSRHRGLHRRSADSPLVGGFFRPLHPLGPHHGAHGGGHHDHHDLAIGHHTRVSARAEDMFAQRLEDLKAGQLAHKPVEADAAGGAARPWRSALRNLPVLLAMAGALAVVLVGTSRLRVPEDLSTVHGVTSAEPYFMPLGSARVDYLYVLATAAPWYGFLPPGAEGAAGGGGGGAHRRRRRRQRALLAAEGGGGRDAAARAAAADAVDAAGDALYRAWESVGWDRAAAERDDGWRLVARAALGAGSRAMEVGLRGGGRRGGGALRRAIESASLSPPLAEPEEEEGAPSPPALAPSRRRRRLAAAADAASPPSALPPRLILQLVEKDVKPPAEALLAGISPQDLPTAVLGVRAYGFSPVGSAQYCQLKDGDASKCHLSFASAAAGAAARPGSPLFFSVSLDQPGTTAVDLHVRELGWLGRAKNWIALSILVAMLLAIASEKVHRMWCAVVASFCMLGLLLWIDMAPDLATVMTWLDESTLGLLFGMMLIVGKVRFLLFFCAAVSAPAPHVFLPSFCSCARPPPQDQTKHNRPPRRARSRSSARARAAWPAAPWRC